MISLLLTLALLSPQTPPKPKHVVTWGECWTVYPSGSQSAEAFCENTSLGNCDILLDGVGVWVGECEDTARAVWDGPTITVYTPGLDPGGDPVVTQIISLASQQWLKWDHSWYEPAGNHAPSDGSGYSNTIRLAPFSAEPTSIEVEFTATHTYRWTWENGNSFPISPYIDWNGQPLIGVQMHVDHELFGFFGTSRADLQEIRPPGSASMVDFSRLAYHPPTTLAAYDGVPLFDFGAGKLNCGQDSWVWQCLGSAPYCQSSGCSAVDPPKVETVTYLWASLSPEERAAVMDGLLIQYLTDIRITGPWPWGEPLSHTWKDYTDARVNAVLKVTTR